MAKRKYPKKGTKAYELRSEYKRLEKNLKRRIENAVKSGRLPQPAKIPDEPKRITEASIRKLKRINEKFWKGPKKEKPPIIADDFGGIDKVIYDNFMYMIVEAVEWAGELYDWVKRRVGNNPDLAKESIFEVWIRNVNNSGKHMKAFSDKCLKSLETELGEKAGFHLYAERIDELYRQAYDVFEFYLHGYQAPDDAEKAGAFILITNILGRVITPAEREMIFSFVMRNNEDETLEIYE